MEVIGCHTAAQHPVAQQQERQRRTLIAMNLAGGIRQVPQKMVAPY
jgi:hypothetical protein